MVNSESILEELKKVSYPGFSRDIVSFGLVKDARVEAGQVQVSIVVQTNDAKVPEQIFKKCHRVLDGLPGVKNVEVKIDVQEPAAQPGTAGGGAQKNHLPGVKHIIAVASGKGGVGKSTVACNLAAALSKQGLKVGLCDCDLYGPSVAHMLGNHERPFATEDNEIIPIESHGIKFMSMGCLLEENSPVIVRGPLATQYTQQFLRNVLWEELDCLILDLPPGTGDIQLTIVQTLALTGAIIVTTPQEVALIDARKAVSMFAKVNVPLLGLVENMAWFECDHGTKYPIFGEGGGVKEAQKLKIPLLAQIPIDIATRTQADAGQPVAFSDPKKNAVSAAYQEVAAKIAVGFS